MGGSGIGVLDFELGMGVEVGFGLVSADGLVSARNDSRREGVRLRRVPGIGCRVRADGFFSGALIGGVGSGRAVARLRAVEAVLMESCEALLFKLVLLLLER